MKSEAFLSLAEVSVRRFLPRRDLVVLSHICLTPQSDRRESRTTGHHSTQFDLNTVKGTLLLAGRQFTPETGTK